jgi:hypothetical protein
MSKLVEQWLLFTYIDGRFTPLSKPFKKKAHAQRAREKYPERQRKLIGLGRLPWPNDLLARVSSSAIGVSRVEDDTPQPYEYRRRTFRNPRELAIAKLFI